MIRIFYYRFKKNYVWLLLNLLALILLIGCCTRHPACWFWWQFQTLIGLFVVTLLLWGYKYLLRHPVAVADDKGIKIDHCRILPWRDIVCAEYRTVRCCFRSLPVIVLHPRKNIRYKYNFLQKRCARMDFTAFSLPLYDVSRQTARDFAALVAEKVGVVKK